MKAHKATGAILESLMEQEEMSYNSLAQSVPFRWHAATVGRVVRGERSLSLKEAVYLSKMFQIPLGIFAEPYVNEAAEWTYSRNGVKAEKLREKIAKMQEELDRLESE